MNEPLFYPNHFADVKRDMLDYYEGDIMSIDVNRVADLVNQRDKLLSLYQELQTVSNHIAKRVEDQWGAKVTKEFCERVLAGERDAILK